MYKTDELRTIRLGSFVTPGELEQQRPVTAEITRNVTMSRRCIEQILTGKDPRLLVIVGSCSIHDTQAAMDYAQRLASMRIHYQNQLEIMMQTYVEKPRTEWTGKDSSLILILMVPMMSIWGSLLHVNCSGD